jgi:hypothetical protein
MILGPRLIPVIPPGPSPVDLHTHSTRSDGVLEPSVLLGAAAAAGVRLLALTDHDTLAGCRDVLATGAVPDGLELITGVEINAVVDRQDLWESELHILGFGMDPADEEFEAILATSERGAGNGSSGPLPACESSSSRSTSRSPSSTCAMTTHSDGRRSRARSWPRVTRRASRTRSSASSGAAAPRTCPGPDSVRLARSRPSGRLAGLRPLPTSARRCRTATCSGS